jgi:AraC-like DNA-binding protein
MYIFAIIKIHTLNYRRPYMRYLDIRQMLVLLLLAFMTSNNVAAHVFTHEEDSIRRKLPQLSGMKKISALNKLCDLAFSDTDVKYELSCINKLKEECARQKFIDGEVFALKLKMNCYYNNDMNSQFMADFPDCLSFLAEYDKWTGYYYVWHNLVKIYIYDEKCETALRETRKLYDDALKRKNKHGLGIAYLCLGQVYDTKRQMKEAAANMEKAIPYLRIDDDASDLVSTFEEYAEVLQNMSNYKRMTTLGNEWKAVIDNYAMDCKKKGIMPSQLDDFYARCYECMGTAAMETGKIDEGGILLYKAWDVVKNQTPLAKASLLFDLARYWDLKKNYDKALECVDMRYHVDSISDNPLGLLDTYEQRAEILMHAGRLAEAALAYQKILPLKDSLSEEDFAHQLNELNTLYKVDELKMEKRLTTGKLYAAMTCLILLSVIIVLYVIHSRRLHRKNKALYDSIVDMQKAQLTVEAVKETIPDDQLDSDELLYRSLCRLMQKDKLYKDSTLKRDDLATMLGTNRTYLSDAVKKYGDGMTITDLINQYRLKHAATLLSEHPEMSINETGDASGFNSRSTYNRLFRDIYGMTPSEYRTVSKEKSLS